MNEPRFTLEQLEQVAEKVLEKFGLQESNLIDISELADEMDVDVFEAELEGDEMLGTVVSNKEEKSIYVSNKLDEREKRFVIATQLAHIILNHDKLPDEEDSEYLIDYKQPYKGLMSLRDFGEKVQASILGAAILMPRKVVSRLADSKEPSVDIYAEYFQVSVRCAYTRLDNLGLLR